MVAIHVQQLLLKEPHLLLPLLNLLLQLRILSCYGIDFAFKHVLLVVEVLILLLALLQ